MLLFSFMQKRGLRQPLGDGSQKHLAGSAVDVDQAFARGGRAD